MGKFYELKIFQGCHKFRTEEILFHLNINSIGRISRENRGISIGVKFLQS